jgi:hypothetical protein
MLFLRTLALTILVACVPHHVEPKSLPTRLREASVIIGVVDPSGLRGYGSGTVFEENGVWVVTTAAHVVTASVGGQLVVWHSHDSSTSSVSIVYVNTVSDFAVLRMAPDDEITPMDFRLGEWELGATLWYVGAPNFNPGLALRGSAAGPDAYTPSWIVQGFAWYGSSGSGVFDEGGHFLGVVSRIDADSGTQHPLESLYYVPVLTLDDVLAVEGLSSFHMFDPSK